MKPFSHTKFRNLHPFTGVRVSNPQRLTHTQIMKYWSSTAPPTPPGCQHTCKRYKGHGCIWAKFSVSSTVKALTSGHPRDMKKLPITGAGRLLFSKVATRDVRVKWLLTGACPATNKQRNCNKTVLKCSRTCM